MRLFIIIILSGCMAYSCSMTDALFNGDKIAQIGAEKLYKEDIEKLIPKGIPPEDSIIIARQYIDSWAIRKLMYLRAQDELPKKDKDVEQLLDDYRMQLLIYRYEDKYIADRLDTLISREESEDYYDSHRQLFVTANGLAKARFVKIRKDSPNLQIIRNLASQDNPESMDELEQAAYNSAERYNNFGNEWADLQDVCREIGMNLESLTNDFRYKRILEYNDSLYVNILVIADKIMPGEISPYEHNEVKIKEIILSKRKQDLISTLHKDIYNNALDTKKLKIIEDEPNN